jgi:hypothetical protein
MTMKRGMNKGGGWWDAVDAGRMRSDGIERSTERRGRDGTSPIMLPYANSQVMPTIPADWLARAANAPVERSSEPEETQVGHMSATGAYTDAPDEVQILT